MSRPIVTAEAILVLIGAGNNYMWPFTITNNPELMTLPVGVSTVKNVYGIIYATTMASATVAALPLTILFVLLQRQIIKAVATTGLGGQQQRRDWAGSSSDGTGRAVAAARLRGVAGTAGPSTVVFVRAAFGCRTVAARRAGTKPDENLDGEHDQRRAH